MGTFAVIRNDGTVLVVNAENENDVIDNVLGSSAINYVRQIEPYDPEKHLSPTEFAAYQERQKAIAAGTAVPGDVAAVNDAFAGVVDQATLDAAIRRVLGMPEPVAPVEPATPDAAVAPDPAAPAPTPTVDETGGITPDPAPFDVSNPVTAPDASPEEAVPAPDETPQG